MVDVLVVETAEAIIEGQEAQTEEDYDMKEHETEGESIFHIVK